MRRGNARTLACAAAAAAGLSLFGAGAAQAQRPEKLGDGIKTGQLGVQMFNYGGYISNGGNTGERRQSRSARRLWRPAPPVDDAPECRLERLEALFKFLQSEGVTNIELFGHAELPGERQTSPGCRPIAR